MKLSNIKSSAQKGFTLIELMITVAIVGLLAAIALPAYNDYTIRAQVSGGLSLASSAIKKVDEYFQNNSELPIDNEDANYEGASGAYVSKVEISDGTINVTFGNKANAGLLGESSGSSGGVSSGSSGGVSTDFGFGLTSPTDPKKLEAGGIGWFAMDPKKIYPTAEMATAAALKWVKENADPGAEFSNCKNEFGGSVDCYIESGGESFFFQNAIQAIPIQTSCNEGEILNNGSCVPNDLGGSNQSGGGNSMLSLVPTIDSTGTIKWNCTSKIKQRYLPKSCTGV